MESFEARVELACSLAEVFDLVTRPTGIQQISPPEMGLSFKQSPERYALGTRIEFSVHAMGLIKEIIHEITVFDEPALFSERQVSGPFRHWVHEHLFEAHESGSGVVVIDRIQFEPPGGLAGMVMNANRIRENLEEGFDYRHGQLEKLFGAF
jgi:ligand-binding SRPBCC domain-containing protein